MMALLVAMVALLIGRPCFAQRIVLVRPPKSDALLVDAFNRLQAELNLQLFEVVALNSCLEPDCPNPTPELVAAQHGAAAVVLRQQDLNTSAEVTLFDRATGQASAHEVAVESGPDAPALIAMRTVDLLRSRLREVPQAPAPPPPKPQKPVPRKPPPAKPVSEPSPTRPNSVRLGAALIITAPELSPGFGSDVVFERLFSKRFRLGLELFGPMVGAKYHSRNGTAFVRQEMGLLRGGYAFWSNDPVALWSNFGLGLYHLDAAADAAPNKYVRQRGQVYSWTGMLSLASALKLSEIIALESEIAALGFQPRPGVAVGEVQTLYRWLVMSATLAVRVNF